MADVSTTRAGDVGKRFRRPLILGIAGSMAAELVIFVVWGLILYPAGDPLVKFLWTVVFCGMSMGAVVGAMIVVFVVDRLDGAAAIAATAMTAAVVLGGACNTLCYRLDAHYFHYFGGEQNPVLFIINGVVMAAIGGAGIGALMFTARGRAWLERVGL